MKLAEASAMRSRVSWTGCLRNRQMDWTISSKSRQSLARGQRPLTERQLRMWGEALALALVVIVVLVVVKPF